LGTGLAPIQTPGPEDFPNEVLHLVDESATLNKGQSYLLLVLSNLPYWERIWIIQEVMLAKNLKMVWGHDSCSRDSLISFANALSNNPVRAPSLSRLIKASYAGRFMSSRGIVRRNNSLLSFVLRLGHHSYCSDPRDKVYGVLGLTIQVEASEFPVSYSKTQGEIWQDAIKFPNFFSGYADEVVADSQILQLSLHSPSSKGAKPQELHFPRSLARGRILISAKYYDVIEIGTFPITPSQACVMADGDISLVMDRRNGQSYYSLESLQLKSGEGQYGRSWKAYI
jgi:hypothetical protein